MSDEMRGWVCRRGSWGYWMPYCWDDMRMWSWKLSISGKGQVEPAEKLLSWILIPEMQLFLEFIGPLVDLIFHFYLCILLKMQILDFIGRFCSKFGKS